MMTSKDQRILELEEQCDKLAKCLGTFIGWSVKDLGHDNVIKLLDMLPTKSLESSTSREE